MSVYTKAVIRKNVTIDQLAEYICSVYGGVDTLHYGDFQFTLVFNDGVRARILHVNTKCALYDTGIDGLYLSLGCFGNSVSVLKDICEKFGGFIDENDSDNVPFYPIRLDLFEQGRELSAKEIFTNKVIAKLGYSNLKAVLELIEEYVALSKV